MVREVGESPDLEGAVVGGEYQLIATNSWRSMQFEEYIGMPSKVTTRGMTTRVLTEVKPSCLTSERYTYYGFQTP